MGQWCGDCPRLRRLRPSGTCKHLPVPGEAPRSRWDRGARVCEAIDPTLPHAYPQADLAALVALDRARQTGALRADALAQNFPTDAASLEVRTLALHRAIFAAEPAIRGRFRRPGEEAYFGGEAQHKQRGAKAEAIPDRLSACLSRFLGARGTFGDAGLFAHHSANFLEEFLLIHPFVDGNGRVARLVLVGAARSWTAWEFDWNAKGGRLSGGEHRRSYIQALQYAHQHVRENEDERRDPAVKYPCGPLARWLEEQLVPAGDDLRDEPPSLTGDESEG